MRRCLAKDPEERWQTAHDLMIQLAWIGRGRTEVTISPATAAAERKRNRLMLIGTACALVFAAALAYPAVAYLRGPAPADPLQFRHTIVGLSANDISVSPDGRSIVFAAKPDTVGATTLFVRPTGSVDSRKLAGTENASQPFWSPDSKFIGFVVGDKLKKMEASGGAVQDVTDAPGFSGGAWSAAAGGTILFGTAKGLNRVSAEGGTAAVITELGQGETGHFWPNFRQVLAQFEGEKVHKSEGIPVYAFARDFVDEVVGLIERRTAMSVSITERELYLTIGDRTLTTTIEEHRLGQATG